MKIWFDVTTPKELLFFESIMERIRLEGHDVLFTTGSNWMVADLCNMRNLHPIRTGYSTGKDKSQRLTISVERAAVLSNLIQKFKPDVTISFCSIEASRVSFGLGIPHMGFSNTPHDEYPCRRSIPLLTKLLTPNHIPAAKFTRYGITLDNIVQYSALDEFLIIHNKPAPHWSIEPLNLKPNKKTLVLKTDNNSIIKEFPECNIIVLTQDPDRIKSLQSFANVTILNQAFDGQKLFSHCDVMIGHNGSVIAQAALCGIPTILDDSTPTINEEYLIRLGILTHASDTIKSIKFIMSKDKYEFQERAQLVQSTMQDPYHTLKSSISVY